MKIEVANGLRYSGLGVEQVEEIYELFLLKPNRYLEVSENIIVEAMKLVHELNDTVYNPIYHVIAMMNNSIFVTFDKRYFNKAVNRDTRRIYS